MLPGGWFGIRREGLGPPGYRGDMKGCRMDRKTLNIFILEQPLNMFIFHDGKDFSYPKKDFLTIVFGIEKLNPEAEDIKQELH